MIVERKTFRLPLALVSALAVLAGCGASKPSGSTADGGLSQGGGSSSGGVTCTGDQVACSGGCASLQSDTQNCGTCAHACAKGQVCVAGDCIATCTGTGGTLCDGGCVNLTTDEANCGACGHACAAGESCANGSCAATGCAAPLTPCGSAALLSCTNLQTDAKNCGSCGNACAAGQSCTDGSCAAAGCAPGQMECGGACTDTQTDPKNCGSCGNACGSGMACGGGQCQACASGETGCAAGCTDTQTDGQNCGSCGNACGSGQTCQAGACANACDVDAGLSACGTGSDLVCVGLATDSANCGSCGHVCAAGQPCVNGGCSLTGCGPSESQCGSSCTNTQSDPANCGACGKVCASGLCHLGSCLFCPAASIGFGPLTLPDAGTSPGFVGVADFNGDGLPDLAAANSGDGTVGILLGTDAGFAAQAAFNANLDTPILAIGDFTGDGRPDVAALSAGTTSFSLLVNQTPDGGALAFALQGPFACTATQFPSTLALVDVNGDGRPDVVVGGMGVAFAIPPESGTLDVFLQSDAGFPATSSSTVSVGQSVQALTAVGLGPDGGQALAVVDNTGATVYVLPFPGLSSPASYAVGNGPVAIVAGDLNGDGLPDLAVLNQTDSTVTVLTGQAGGTFTAESPVSVLGSGFALPTLVPQALAVGDVNGDGIPDLVVSVADTFSLGGDVVNYLINQGNGTFAPPVSVPAAATGFTPLSVELADLGGGLPAMVLGNSGTGDFAGVIYGKCP